jgi:predicted dehydrogenase
MRVAVIGLGAAGCGLHLPALAGMKSVTVVGACDLDSTNRERAAAVWKVPVFSDADAMLRNVGADVVVIATPPDSHCEWCLRALAARAHVVCEKPFASSVAEADRVIAAAVAAGRHVVVNHEFREMPIFRALVDEIAAGRAGDLQFVQAWQRVNMPAWTEAGWRGRMGERTLFEAGVHLVDFLIALYREVPTAVHASMSGGATQGRQHDAIVLATLEFSGSRLAQLTQNRVSRGEPQYFEVRADTEQASFRASFGGHARLSLGFLRAKTPHFRVQCGLSGIAWREDGTRRTLLARNPRNPNVIATRRVLEDAFGAFVRETPTGGPVARARDVLQVVAACYRSAATGERVRLDSTQLPRLSDYQMGTPSGVRT